MVATSIRAAFDQEDAEAARCQVADSLQPRFAKLAALMDTAESEVLAHIVFHKEHRMQIHSTNPLVRLNGQIKGCADVVGICPNEDAVTRLVDALLLEQNDEWAIQRRYMSLETLVGLRDDQSRLPAIATA